MASEQPMPHMNPMQRPKSAAGPKEVIEPIFLASGYTATVKLSSVRVTAW